MASAAFKSTSKRGNLSSNTHNSHNSNSTSNSTSNSNPTIRKRSQSVSAISRTKQTLEISSEFSNKRENPLFWTTSTSPHNDQEKSEVSLITAFGKGTEKEKEKEKRVVESTTVRASGATSAASSAAAAAAAERGRSVTRNSGVKNGIGRSLSRVRGRSVSRGPYGTYESDKEQELVPLTNAHYSIDFKKVANTSKNANIVRNRADVRGRIKNSQMGSSQHQATECSEDDSVCSFQFSNWEDGTSPCSLSEAEERTIKAVCEQVKGDQRRGDAAASGIYETVRSEVRRAISDIQNDIESAIRRGNVSGVVTMDNADISPDMVNSGAEFVSDIRREYARKLEESEERARKLRADLAVEELRGHEFSRVLKETLPDPKSSNPQKSRMGRKRSTERKKMSKRLTEEAMAYFDECVSISTFDSSDFSASEDRPHISAGPSVSVDGPVSRLQGSSSTHLPLYAPDSFSNNKQVFGDYCQLMHGGEDSNLTANSSSTPPTMDQVDQANKSRGSSQRYQFSFAQKPKQDTVPQNNIKNYIRHFDRGINKDVAGSDYTRFGYDSGESDLHGCLESLLFHRVFFRSRVESGNLHLCGGSIPVSFSPFGSVL